jgi:hypothetical protein
MIECLTVTFSTEAYLYCKELFYATSIVGLISLHEPNGFSVFHVCEGSVSLVQEASGTLGLFSADKKRRKAGEDPALLERHSATVEPHKLSD